jgi:antitoxin ParD1/3/4
MAKTALNLGSHWDSFIDDQVRSGRYASADDVIRDALKGLEDQDRKLSDLRRQIAEGAEQADRGEFVDADFLDRLVEDDISNSGQ